LQKFVDEVIEKCTGTSYPSINSKDLSKICVCFPSAAEQQKIASFFTAIDLKISQLKRKLYLLEQYKKGLMQKIFLQEIRFKPAPSEVEWKNGHEFPKWEKGKMGSLIDLISGYPFDGNDISENESGTSILRGINITEGYIRHSKEIDRYYCDDINNVSKYLLKKGDLVIGMDGSKVGKNSALISEMDEGSLLIQRVARIRSNAKSNIGFLFQIVF
jgi:type I restriction enzyme S subunit